MINHLNSTTFYRFEISKFTLILYVANGMDSIKISLSYYILRVMASFFFHIQCSHMVAAPSSSQGHAIIKSLNDEKRRMRALR